MTGHKFRRGTGRARQHWSYSQLAQYMRCPLQYFFERVACLPRPFTPSSLALGSAIHVGLATYHQQVQQSGEANPNAVQEAFLLEWEEQELGRPIQYAKQETRDDALGQGSALLQAYLVEPPPQQIVAVEEAMVVPLVTSEGEILDRPLLAIVDLLHRQEGTLTVAEFKTSSRKYSEQEVASTLQATCYAHAVKERYDEAPEIEYTVLVKTKRSQVQRLRTKRSEADCARLGDVAQQIQKAVATGIYYPNESAMNCSSCPFRAPCRDWQGTKGTNAAKQSN